jgi:uncharacterized iron-regulated membrane protein
MFLRTCRLIHLYLGVFTAPALLFFAFTGALQTFSLHETTKGSSYTPPAWAMTLAQIHKKQTPVIATKKQPPAPAPKAQDGRGHAAEADTAPRNPDGAPTARKHHSLPLKIFFLVVSISLFLSVLTGIYMSYKYMRNRTAVTVLLLLGAGIPIALLFL